MCVCVCACMFTMAIAKAQFCINILHQSTSHAQAEFLRRERERRRVQRLVQVREQSKQHAQRIRTGYQQLCQEEGQFQEKMQRVSWHEGTIEGPGNVHTLETVICCAC